MHSRLNEFCAQCIESWTPLICSYSDAMAVKNLIDFARLLAIIRCSFDPGILQNSFYDFDCIEFIAVELRFLLANVTRSTLTSRSLYVTVICTIHALWGYSSLKAFMRPIQPNYRSVFCMPACRIHVGTFFRGGLQIVLLSLDAGQQQQHHHHHQ